MASERTTTRLLEDDEFLTRACEQYARDCERNGWVYQQPSNSSEIDGNRITLENVRGVLAIYEARRNAGGRVRLVRIEDADVGSLAS